MTREDCQLIADAMHKAKPTGCGEADHAQWQTDCRALAYALNKENDKFRTDIFLAACRIGGDV